MGLAITIYRLNVELHSGLPPEKLLCATAKSYFLCKSKDGDYGGVA